MGELVRLALFLLLVGCATAALARSYEQRAKNHGTDEPAPKIAPPVDCFNQTKMRTYLNDEQATRLCRCQHSARNVDCFLDAKRTTFLNDEQAVRLCAGVPHYYYDLNCLD
ncbi:MAG: hypothetical protein HY074_05970 [Deltaproteobacteria bacterium]|nr:hypothetical protein [Deltaproteobacteria bacterium]